MMNPQIVLVGEIVSVGVYSVGRVYTTTEFPAFWE